MTPASAAAADGALCVERRLPPSASRRVLWRPYHNDACGACDVCLKELEPSPEPIVLARKILSCVARVGQRFGSTHVASVLRGQTSEQVLARATTGSPRSVCCRMRQSQRSAVTSNSFWARGSYGRPTMYPVVALTRKGLELLKDPAAPDWRSPASGRHEEANHARSLASRRNRGKTSIATSSNGCVRSD